MKLKILVFIVLGLLLFTTNCQDNGNVEIISNSELDYIHIKNEYWEKDRPDLLSFSYGQIKKMSEVVERIRKKMQEDTSFEYAIYINERGEVEKLKPIESSFKEIDQLLAREMKTWTMNQYLKNNTPSKYRINWNFEIKDPMLKEKTIGCVSSNFPIIEKFLDKEFFVTVDEMPIPIGGIKSIAENVVYPEKAKKEGIQGKVYVRALIDEEGNVVAANLIKGLSNECNKSALDAIVKAKFIPASLNGKSVGAQVSIPIMFKLN